jgi:hypothetical protein
MHRRDIQLVGLLAWLAAAGNLAGAATGGTNIPSPGSTTSDGFTVSAQWHAHYTFKNAVYWRPSRSEQGFLGARPRDFFPSAGAEVDVTEEVNKQTGQHRAVLKNGEWHWQDGLGRSASGGFGEPVIRHWWDAQTGKTMVAFGISPTDPANIKELVKAGSLPHIGTLTCEVLFETRNLAYREIRLGPPGTNWESELIIRRTEQKLEAEIKPGDGVKDLVPTMTGVIPFEVRLVSPPDLPVQWKISLYKTSNLPGVCCNAEMPPKIQAQWENKIKRDSYDLIFDFRKYGKTDSSFKPVDETWQVLETSKPVNSIGFAVNCLDYGASGRVMAIAEFDSQVVAATYKETGETFVRIPYAKNKNDQHRIADAATPTGLSTRYPAGSPDADDDNDPPNAKECQGDGLSVFEEYRGFVCKAGFASGAGGFEHVRLDPKKKDLFVFTDGFSEELAAYLPAFANASQLNVHWLGDDDDGFVRASDRVVNFDSDKASAKLQHALNLLEDKLSGGVNGQTSDFGPPKYVSSVKIDVDHCRDTANLLPRMADQLKRVVIHELGHGVGIQHHGDSNDRPKGIAFERGQNSGDVNCAMKYVLWRFYQHQRSKNEPSPTPHLYDPEGKEKPGLTFCTSPMGNEYNKVGAEHWQCGDAERGRGNCSAQIRVNDAAPHPKKASGEDVTASSGAPQIPPDDETEKTSRESQKRAGVVLWLRFGREPGQIIPGEAIRLEVSLRGTISKAGGGTWDAPAPSGKAQADFGATDRPWTNQIHFLILDENGKLVPLPARSYLVGAVQRVDSYGSHEFPDPKIEAKPDTIYLATFAIDGAQTEKWAPGTRRIFAAIPSGKPGASGDITSRSIMLPVIGVDALPSDEQKSAPARRELSQGYIELAAKHWTEAEKRARAAISAMPDSTEPYLLLARSLEAQDKPKEAYAAYNEALSRYKPAPGLVAEPPEAIFAALKALEAKLGIQPEPPPAAAMGPLASHSLFAARASGKLNPPFPPNPDRLVFEWQLAEAGGDPLGVRWIAEEVAGVEKNHVIATAKSEPNKQSGQFSLTTPTAGFPPGQYRVEIWQAGKMIYSEKFEIKSE